MSERATGNSARHHGASEPAAVFDDKLLVAAYRGGASVRSLAAALGWTRSQVERRLAAYGEPKRTRPVLPADPSWWRQRFAAGASVASIADELAVARTTAYRHVHHLGLSVARPAPETFEEWLHGHVRRDGDCLIWQGAVTRDGHPYGNYAARKFLVRREQWVRRHGPLHSSDEVYRAPTCPHRLCVALGHLRVNTVADRIKALAADGVYAHGEHHWNAKLTEDQARDILTSHASVSELATRHHVSRSTVRAIQTGKRWKHLHT